MSWSNPWCMPVEVMREEGETTSHIHERVENGRPIAANRVQPADYSRLLSRSADDSHTG